MLHVTQKSSVANSFPPVTDRPSHARIKIGKYGDPQIDDSESKWKPVKRGQTGARRILIEKKNFDSCAGWGRGWGWGGMAGVLFKTADSTRAAPSPANAAGRARRREKALTRPAVLLPGRFPTQTERRANLQNEVVGGLLAPPVGLPGAVQALLVSM